MPRTNEHADRQPRDVSATVTNYLDMTGPRGSRKRHETEPELERQRERPGLIDNEGLPLEEGNDLA